MPGNDNAPKKSPPPQKRRKVNWSMAEQKALIRRAVDLHDERPDLAGLPLLREAAFALPVDRRRKVRSLRLVPWFEEGLTAELRRRREQAEAKEAAPPPTPQVPQADDPSIPIMRAYHDKLDEQLQAQVAWREAHLQMLGRFCDLMAELVEVQRECHARLVVMTHGDDNSHGNSPRRQRQKRAG